MPLLCTGFSVSCISLDTKAYVRAVQFLVEGDKKRKRKILSQCYSMDVSLFPKPQSVFSSSIPPSPAFSLHCHPQASPRREFLSCGICIRPPDTSCPRTSGKLGLRLQSSRFLSPTSTYGRLLVARSKKKASKVCFCDRRFLCIEFLCIFCK